MFWSAFVTVLSFMVMELEEKEAVETTATSQSAQEGDGATRLEQQPHQEATNGTSVIQPRLSNQFIANFLADLTVVTATKTTTNTWKDKNEIGTNSNKKKQPKQQTQPKQQPNQQTQPKQQPKQQTQPKPQPKQQTLQQHTQQQIQQNQQQSTTK